MVRLSYLFLLLILTYSSCTRQKSNNMKTQLVINNKILKNEIIRYTQEVEASKIKYKYPYLTINDLGADTVEYTINYFYSPHFFNYHPIAFFVETENLLVPVEIQGLMFKSEFMFELKKDVVMDYVKKYFPLEYKYYLENKDYPPPPTVREISWILIFKEGKLIEKKEIVN